uniref:Uncharacterized protein n=1 Tax=Panagrolaimus superbus TaxID=310955 RepID=A0A914Y8U3_9BILA
MTSTQRINTQQLTITDTISKCLVVIFLKKMSADVATTKYMDTLLGVSTESIRQVKPFSIADQNITVIFVEMCDTRLASFVYNQWKSNNTDQTVTLYTASEYLCNVAAKKFQEPSFNNPGSAFHALFKPSALSALMFQQPQTVSVQVQSNTAPVQQLSNNHFQFNTRPQAQQFRPPSFNNVIEID